MHTVALRTHTHTHAGARPLAWRGNMKRLPLAVLRYERLELAHRLLQCDIGRKRSVERNFKNKWSKRKREKCGAQAIRVTASYASII